MPQRYKMIITLKPHIIDINHIKNVGLQKHKDTYITDKQSSIEANDSALQLRLISCFL